MQRPQLQVGIRNAPLTQTRGTQPRDNYGQGLAGSGANVHLGAAACTSPPRRNRSYARRWAIESLAASVIPGPPFIAQGPTMRRIGRHA